MSRYVPVSTKMDSEDHYHSPYDTNELDSDVSFSPEILWNIIYLFAYVFVFVHKKNNFIMKTQAHYEAPSCLKRNPSGSLFIPSGKQQQSYYYIKNHFLSSQKSLLRSQRSNHHFIVRYYPNIPNLMYILVYASPASIPPFARIPSLSCVLSPFFETIFGHRT